MMLFYRLNHGSSSNCKKNKPYDFYYITHISSKKINISINCPLRSIKKLRLKSPTSYATVPLFYPIRSFFHVILHHEFQVLIATMINE